MIEHTKHTKVVAHSHISNWAKNVVQMKILNSLSPDLQYPSMTFIFTTYDQTMRSVTHRQVAFGLPTAHFSTGAPSPGCCSRLAICAVWELVLCHVLSIRLIFMERKEGFFDALLIVIQVSLVPPSFQVLPAKYLSTPTGSPVSSTWPT